MAQMIWLRSFLQSFLAPKRCLFDLLILCMVLSSIPAYALDKYDDDMTTTTGWTAATGGGTTATVTEDGRTCLRLQTGASAGTYAQLYRALPVSGAVNVIKFSTKVVSLGTKAAGQAFSVSLRGSSTTSNFTSVSQYSDGIYTSGTDNAGLYEIGTDLVDVSTWTDWEFRVVAPTPATAKMQVWKNNVKVGEDLDVSRLDGGNYPARFTLYIGTADTTQRAVYIDSISVSSYGLQYFENCDSITDWTDADAVNGVSSQSTVDSMTVFDMYSPTSGSSSRAFRYFDGIAYPANYIVETKLKNVSLGTIAANDQFLLMFVRKSTYANIIYFSSDGLFLYVDGAGYVEQGTNIVDINTWTTWRFFIKNDAADGAKVWIWKNGVLVVSNSTMKTSITSNTPGRISIMQNGYTLSGARTYVDYLRIYSEDGQLIQTIIE